MGELDFFETIQQFVFSSPALIGLAETDTRAIDAAPVVSREKRFEVFFDFMRIRMIRPTEFLRDVRDVRIHADCVGAVLGKKHIGGFSANAGKFNEFLYIARRHSFIALYKHYGEGNHVLGFILKKIHRPDDSGHFFRFCSSSKRSSASFTSLMTSSTLEIPDFLQLWWYKLPGSVFTSLTNILLVALSMRKSTRAMPEHPSAL